MREPQTIERVARSLRAIHAGPALRARFSASLTVLAPTDEAFAKLPGGTVDSLLRPDNREQLVAIVKKQLKLEGSLYRILQILSVSLFEKTPILEALSLSDYEIQLTTAGKQLILFH